MCQVLWHRTAVLEIRGACSLTPRAQATMVLPAVGC